MKKIKAMLIAIAIIGTIGGILAFKTMTPGSYCTNYAVTTTVGGPFICPFGRLCPNLTFIVLTTTTATTNIFCYTIADHFGNPCQNDIGATHLCGTYRATTTIEID